MYAPVIRAETARLIELAGFIIGVLAVFVAVVVGFIHGVQIHRVAKELIDNLEAVGAKVTCNLEVVGNELTTRVEEVRLGLTTRPLFEFPHYLDKIADLVNEAEYRIDICCDHPAYGSYSDPAAYSKYQVAIHSQITLHRRPTFMYCMEESLRIESAKRQINNDFLAGDTWEVYKDKNYEKLDKYLNHHPGKHSAKDITLAQFTEVILEEDADALRPFIRSKQCKFGKTPPIYFWYIDGAMVFSIPGSVHAGDRGEIIPGPTRLTEHGFFTKDQNLIKGFLALTEHHTGYRFKEHNADGRLGAVT
jgi:hypothetical protein